MPKYRKKPIVVEADLFHSKGNIPEGVFEKETESFGLKFKDFYISTLEGDMMVRDGDMIITGVNGEKYPCKPDIFEKTYERVEDV